MKQIKTKRGYKILAWVVLLVMIVGIVPVSNVSHASETGYTESIIWEDTFDAGTSWDTSNYHWRLDGEQYAGVRNGTAPLGYNTAAARQLYKGNGDGDASMTDVYIKADVCVTSSTGVNATNHQYHFIFARGNASASGALGFGLKTTKDATASSLIVAKFDNNPTTAYYESQAIYNLGEAYTLELYVVDNLVIAKCDGLEVFRGEVTGINANGYCGLRDRLATNQITSGTLSSTSVYGTDYTKRGYFDNFSIGTVEEAERVELSSTPVIGTDGNGVADLTFYRGGEVSRVLDDASVTIAALKDKQADYYESDSGYEVVFDDGGTPVSVTAKRVFVVDDLTKTVTKMDDNRWTGDTKDDEPNFDVSADGKATLKRDKNSVLSLGTEDAAYSDFYVEYTLNLSIPGEYRTWDYARYVMGTRTSKDVYYSGDVIYDLQSSATDQFYGRLMKKASGTTASQISSKYANGVSGSDVAAGTNMKIGMWVCNNSITYTINGNVVATDSVSGNGWFLLRHEDNNASCRAVVSNFVCVPLTRRTVDVTFEAPEAVMQGDAWNVTATPTYSWPYGVGEPVTTGITIGNFSNSILGLQKATLTYDGISKEQDVTVVEKPDGFKFAGPAVVNPNGIGVADIIIMSGVNEIERIEDAPVTVAGFENAPIGLYEENREAEYTHTAITMTPWKANATRVFVVQDVAKAVTNMTDDRWTGNAAESEPNFTVDATSGKATFPSKSSPSTAMSVLNGADGNKYGNFYVEYDLTMKNLQDNVNGTWSNFLTMSDTYGTYNADVLETKLFFDTRKATTHNQYFWARLRELDASKEQQWSYSYSNNFVDTEIAEGTVMHVSMLVLGNEVRLSLNGEDILSGIRNEDYQGRFAMWLDAGTAEAVVENFLYIPLDGLSQKLVDVEFDCPKAILPNQTPEVKATPVYNWPYEKGGAVTEGVVLTGLDTSTLGKKEFKASYQGVEKQLELEVSNVLFQELFDGDKDDLTQNGWGKVTDKSVTLQDETLHLAGTSAQEGLYLTELSGSENWTDYTVQADVSFDKYTDLEKTITATLAARASGMKDGYEWSLLVEKNGASYVRLYDRAAGKQLIRVDYPVDPLEVYTMKLTVVGNVIKGYINGEKIVETTAATSEKGSIGVRCWANGVTYDNVLVSLPEEDVPILDVSQQQVWFTDTFEGENAMSERGWNVDSQIKNGSAILDKTQESMFLNQINGCEDWIDYTVEADVTVVDSDEISSVGTNVGALVFRSTSSKTGYEFGVVISSNTGKGGFRLYNRTTKEQMFSSNEIETERGKTYRLRAVAEGNHILCFADDKLIFEFVDDTNPKGYVGLRSAGYSDAFDNVVVRKIVSSDRQGKIQTGSPNTGDSQISVFIPISFMILASITVFVTMQRRRYKKNSNI